MHYKINSIIKKVINVDYKINDVNKWSNEPIYICLVHTILDWIHSFVKVNS